MEVSLETVNKNKLKEKSMTELSETKDNIIVLAVIFN